MNPYSHLVVASRLEWLVQPEDPGEYYWGAIVPDIRYLASMRRQQTHLPAREIIALRDRHPHLASFVQGYLIHCLTDQIDLSRVFSRHLPFSVLKGKLSHQHLAVLLELYNLETQPASRPLSGTYNDVLCELGLSRSVTARYAQFAKQYAMPDGSPNLMELLHMMGLEHDSRIEKYIAAGKSFQQSRLLKQALFLGIRAGRIDQRIASRVATLYRRSGAGTQGRPGPGAG